MNAADLARMPAFPVPLPDGTSPPDECLAILQRSRGVTVRQHLAGLALQGLLANAFYAEDARRGDSTGTLAAAALYHADELIAELAKPVKP